jgi:hypothetical protein
MLFNDNKPFDTNAFYVGGNGMFIQYHDIVKPVYLYAIFKMIITKSTYGLPIHILNRMSILSFIEWYLKRRYINPLRCLDYQNQVPIDVLDNLLHKILNSDPSIYKLSPTLNIQAMMDVYRKQSMIFPVFIYSKNEEPNILTDIKEVFSGVKVKYLHGDLKEAISKCDQNFTYIFSDIELLKEACTILHGTYSHILLARDYRYNYIDNCKTLKYDLYDLTIKHPFIRTGLILASDMNKLALSFGKIMSLQGGD